MARVSPITPWSSLLAVAIVLRSVVGSAIRTRSLAAIAVPVMEPPIGMATSYQRL